MPCNCCGECLMKNPAMKMKLCANCKNVEYCSKECQKKDWNTPNRFSSFPEHLGRKHKDFCKEWLANEPMNKAKEKIGEAPDMLIVESFHEEKTMEIRMAGDSPLVRSLRATPFEALREKGIDGLTDANWREPISESIFRIKPPCMLDKYPLEYFLHFMCAGRPTPWQDLHSLGADKLALFSSEVRAFVEQNMRRDPIKEAQRIQITGLSKEAALQRCKQLRLVKVDLEEKNQTDGPFKKPLMDAAYLGKAEGCSLLLEAGADMFAVDIKGWNAMHWGAAGGHECATVLLSMRGGAKLLQSTSWDGYTCLMAAATFCRVPITKLLISLGGKRLLMATGKSGATAISIAVQTKCQQMIDLLTSEIGRAEAPQLSISEARDPSSMKVSKLKKAISELGGSTAGLFEKADLCAELRRLTPKEDVSLMTKEEALKISESKGLFVRHIEEFDTDRLQMTPLMNATAGGVEGVELLLKAGASPFAVDIQGHTPLHHAVMNNNLPACEALLRTCPDPRRLLMASTQDTIQNTGKPGGTCLHIAANCGHTDIGRLLIDKGGEDLCNALYQRREMCVKTCLHAAVFTGQVDFVEMLISKLGIGFFRKLQNDEALFWAVYNNSMDMLKLLLEKIGVPPLLLRRTEFHTKPCRMEVNFTILETLVQASGSSQFPSASGPFGVEMAKYLVETCKLDMRVFEIGSAGFGTLLSFAAGLGSIELVQWLVETRGEAYALTVSTTRRSTKTSCLLMAAESGKKDTVRYLASLPTLGQKLLHLKHSDGKTALHCMAEEGKRKMCGILARAGGIRLLCKKSGFGLVASEHARAAGHREVSDMLQELYTELTESQQSNGEVD